MATIGSLDRRIAIHRLTTVQGRLNEPVGTWQSIGAIWSQRRDVSDGEMLVRASDGWDAGKRGSVLMARFLVRRSGFSDGIRTTDRIWCDGRMWSIRGVKETTHGRRRFLEITAAHDLDTEDAD